MPDELVLDEVMFQQLLAAAYILQEERRRLLAKQVAPGCTAWPGEAREEDAGLIRTTSGTLTQPAAAELLLPNTSINAIARKPPQAVHPDHSPRTHPTIGDRFLLTDQLFWKAATVVAAAAVSALFLGASFHRYSALPPGLSLPPESVQQQVPFHGTKYPDANKTVSGSRST